MKLPQLALRELFWLVLVCALACGWWLDHLQQLAVIQETTRGANELRDERDHWKKRAIRSEAIVAFQGLAWPEGAFNGPSAEVEPLPPANEGSDSQSLILAATLSTLAATLTVAAIIAGLAYLIHRSRLRTPAFRLFSSPQEAFAGLVGFLILGCLCGGPIVWFVYSSVWCIFFPPSRES